MNLEKIKEIVNQKLLSDKEKELLIIDEIAKSDDALPTILAILDSERNRNRKLITDLNVLLSKADVVLNEPELNKDNFVQKEIAQFYKEHEIKHCFNISNE